MRRIFYFLYYLKNLDWRKYLKFLKYISSNNIIRINIDVFKSVFKYNISLLEYFQFKFQELNHLERKTYAGTGYMYEYQLIMNPKKYRSVLEDKRLFLVNYDRFIHHKSMSLEALIDDPASFKSLLNGSGKIILKSHDGQCGWGIEVMETIGLDSDSLIAQLKKTGNDLVEEYIIQHPKLMELSPSGLNTVRIYTQLTSKDEVELLGSRLRITVNSHVDNMAAGNIVAPIEENTGIVCGPAVYSDITKRDQFTHPVTNIPIVGFEVPFWQETLIMVKEAALSNKGCRSIGWDIAISEKGPELVEGNHDWCKLVWQLPVRQGLKPILEKHLLEYKKMANK